MCEDEGCDNNDIGRRALRGFLFGKTFFYEESEGLCCQDRDADAVCVRPHGMFLDIPDLSESSLCRTNCDTFGPVCLGYDYRSMETNGRCTVLGPNITAADVYTVNLISPAETSFQWISGTGGFISGGQNGMHLGIRKCYLKVYSNHTTTTQLPCGEGTYCGNPCYSNYRPPEGCDGCKRQCPYFSDPTLSPVWGNMTNDTLSPTYYPSFIPSHYPSINPTASTSAETTSTKSLNNFGDLFTTTSLQDRQSEQPEQEEPNFWFTPQGFIIIAVVGIIIIVVVWTFACQAVDEEKEFTNWAHDKARRVSTYFGVGDTGTGIDRQNSNGGMVDIDAMRTKMELQQMKNDLEMQAMVINQQAQQMHMANGKKPRRSHNMRGSMMNPRGKYGRGRPMHGKFGQHGKMNSKRERKKQRRNHAKSAHPQFQMVPHAHGGMQEVQMVPSHHMNGFPPGHVGNPNHMNPRKTLSRRTKAAKKGKRKNKQKKTAQPSPEMIQQQMMMQQLVSNGTMPGMVAPNPAMMQQGMPIQQAPPAVLVRQATASGGLVRQTTVNSNPPGTVVRQNTHPRAKTPTKQMMANPQMQQQIAIRAMQPQQMQPQQMPQQQMPPQQQITMRGMQPMPQQMQGMQQGGPPKVILYE